MIDINKQILPHEWMQYSQQTKMRLKEIFDIPQSSSVSVVDNRVESDGHTLEDLSRISVEKMKVFTGSSNEDFRELLGITINKIISEADVVVSENKNNEESTKKTEESISTEAPEQKQGASRGRPKKGREGEEIKSNS